MKKSLLFSFSLIGTIGFATALPLVALTLLGRYLDRQFNTGHDLFYAGLVIATVIVYFTIKQIVGDAVDKFDKLQNTKSEIRQSAEAKKTKR
ncbi:MAG: AtpZ/AtpI family protein [bacterium]|nr:AtpZ/AtpI family protein [bacterium]